MKGRLFTGTSGWSYSDWVPTVYPARLKASESLAAYARVFKTVELNATFYRLPRVETIAGWRQQAGAEFTWAVKASEWITHIRRLQDAQKDLDTLLERAAPLLEGGVLLFQLPGSFREDGARLEAFLDMLPKNLRCAFEFRHGSWFSPATFERLAKRQVALVGVNAPGIPEDLRTATAPFGYWRLHGSSRWYLHNYSKEELDRFAAAARDRLQQGDLYVYFDNTMQGHGYHNAREFGERLKEFM